MTEDEIKEYFDSLVADREKMINNLIFVEPDLHRAFAAIKVDQEELPLTTNQKMLADIGIDTDTADIQTITSGLARWNIFLLDTDHLTDEELLKYLREKILIEKIRRIPPNPDFNEFITCEACEGSANKDAEGFVSRDALFPRPPAHRTHSTVVPATPQ